MISESNHTDSINSCSDMIWYQSKILPSYYHPFCDDDLKQVREYTTLHPHLNYNKTINNTFESRNKNEDDDAVESKGELIGKYGHIGILYIRGSI